MSKYHTPVLLHEVVDALQLQPGSVVIDGTIGGGGHSREILKRIQPGGTLIGIDQDQSAIEYVQATLGKQYTQEQFQLIYDNFSNIYEYEGRFRSFHRISAILLDLGVSNFQIRTKGRGFSFQEPLDQLDMRMDMRNQLTAQYLVNTLSQSDLVQVFKDYGEEPRARTIARLIVERRQTQTIKTVDDLLVCIKLAYRGISKPKSHLATRTFQALRIAVNKELDRLPTMIEQALKILSPGGRLAIITFHSLEDRIVKQQFNQAAKDCICPPDFPVCQCNHQARLIKITKKPIIPSVEEIKQNPQARSAKLRVVKKQ